MHDQAKNSTKADSDAALKVQAALDDSKTSKVSKTIESETVNANDANDDDAKEDDVENPLNTFAYAAAKFVGTILVHIKANDEKHNAGMNLKEEEDVSAALDDLGGYASRVLADTCALVDTVTAKDTGTTTVEGPTVPADGTNNSKASETIESETVNTNTNDANDEKTSKRKVDDNGPTLGANAGMNLKEKEDVSAALDDLGGYASRVLADACALVDTVTAKDTGTTTVKGPTVPADGTNISNSISTPPPSSPTDPDANEPTLATASGKSNNISWGLLITAGVFCILAITTFILSRFAPDAFKAIIGLINNHVIISSISLGIVALAAVGALFYSFKSGGKPATTAIKADATGVGGLIKGVNTLCTSDSALAGARKPASLNDNEAEKNSRRRL